MNLKLFSKRLGILLTSMALVMPTVNATSLSDSNVNHESNIATYIDLTNLSEDTYMSEVMTYDEIVNEISINENISLDEAKALIGEEVWRPYNEVVNEIATIKNISLDEAEKLIDTDNIQKTRSGLQVRATYRTLKVSVTVNSTYKPEINWYCETSEYGNFHGIVKIVRTSLNRSYNGKSKQFDGDIYSHLERGDRIYYELNGDFYNNGTTTITHDISLNLGEAGSTSFSVSSSQNHYAYCFKTGYFRW